MSSLRRFLLVLSCTAAMVLGTAPGPAASAADHGPLLWGAHAAERPAESPRAAVRRMEAEAGRKLGVVREFLLWDEHFPAAFHRWLGRTDRTPIFSVRAMRTDGRPVRWRDIAAAEPGTALHDDIVRWADRMRAFADHVYFSFNHEPETVVNLPMGVDSEFIAAWRKVRSVFRERRATNVTFMWIMTDYSFFAAPDDRRFAAKWYPGNRHVEAIGADAYNWFRCRAEYKSPWKSLRTIIRPFRDFGREHPREELWLAEWATVEDPAVPGRKARWIHQARRLLKRDGYSQFVGVSYFDSYKRAECPWPVETSRTALDAFRRMGDARFYGG